tara:strand:- start:3335 stop:3973 length:639 start_codon:yes stop_codon:yes gene_type:complete
MEKPNYYAIISADVRYDNRLRPNVKLMYAEITALCGMNGKCFASNKYFSDLYDKSKGTISGWISELVKYGYIKTEYTYKGGTKEIDNRYIKIMKGGIGENSNTLLQKTLKSNTINNNTNITYNNNKRFKKPTILEVKKYCIERKNKIDAEAFIAFYESKNWYVGSNKMSNWKQAIITWEKREKKELPQTMSKIHQHLQKNLNVKEKLKKQFE